VHVTDYCERNSLHSLVEKGM